MLPLNLEGAELYLYFSSQRTVVRCKWRNIKHAFINSYTSYQLIISTAHKYRDGHARTFCLDAGTTITHGQEAAKSALLTKDDGKIVLISSGGVLQISFVDPELDFVS